MTRAGTIALTSVTMVAFAANSVLCRLALSQTGVDPATFTLVRIGSGAAMLAMIAAVAGRGRAIGGSWRAALALFAYAAAFSFAYLSLPAGAGALILFGAVQATMVVTGLVRGEHLPPGQWLGLAAAIGGLIVLVAPGVSAPPLARGGADGGGGGRLGRLFDPGPARFGPARRHLRQFPSRRPDGARPRACGFRPRAPPALGIAYAVLSGAAASGLGYTIWYAALPGLSAVEAASVQLSVPVIAALGGTFFLAETISLRLALAAAAVLGGIGLVIASRPGRR